MMKEKLEEAYRRKEDAIETFVWKGEKRPQPDGTFAQDKILLVDCTEKQLQEFYDHCNSMLNSDDHVHPGRKVLLDIIKDQRNRCNAELFIRYIEKEEKIVRVFNFLAPLSMK